MAWLLGAAAGTLAAQEPLYVFHGTNAEDQLGHVVRIAGDVDADGYDDIILGMPRYDGVAGVDAGRVLVISGADGTTVHYTKER